VQLAEAEPFPWQPTLEAAGFLASRCARRVAATDVGTFRQLLSEGEVAAAALGAQAWPPGPLFVALAPPCPLAALPGGGTVLVAALCGDRVRRCARPNTLRHIATLLDATASATMSEPIAKH